MMLRMHFFVLSILNCVLFQPGMVGANQGVDREVQFGAAGYNTTVSTTATPVTTTTTTIQSFVNDTTESTTDYYGDAHEDNSTEDTSLEITTVTAAPPPSVVTPDQNEWLRLQSYFLKSIVNSFKDESGNEGRIFSFLHIILLHWINI